MNRRMFLMGTASLAAGAKRGSRSQSRRSHTIAVGDAQIQVVLEYGPQGLSEAQYQIEQRTLESLRGNPWTIQLDGTTLSPVGMPASLLRHDGTPLARSAAFGGDADGIAWELTYELSGPGRITKSLKLYPRRDDRLVRAALWKAEWPNEPGIARTKIQEIAAFYRQNRVGLFASLDFPYSNIAASAGVTTVSYPPYDVLKAGREYSCHSLTFGAVRLTGRERYGFDDGEVEAMDAYVQGHRQPRFDRPMFTYASIINRYTQVAGDIIFYTMQDQPLLSFNTHLVEQDLALMAKLGMEYYQVFPGVFEWASDDPKSEVDRLVGFARERGVRIGDYSGTSYVYSPHFNFPRNKLDRPDWLIRDKDGNTKRKIYCFGNLEFVDLYIRTVVSSCRRYGFDLHCLDLLQFAPCYASNHQHPAGIESYYHQVRGLLRIIEAINAVSPQMMTWPNSGDFVEMLPKLAWYSPNLYLTDPFIRTPWQGLNMTRLLDEARREQMVSIHHSAFLPYRFFTNFQYFFSQNSILPDIRNFEYGALSTIAVTPNVGLGEIRPWLARLPASDQAKVIAFYEHWTKFLRDHYTLWTRTYQVGENPGMGAVEIYGHAAGDRGFIFLVNPNYWDRTVEAPLDMALGFTGAGQCEIAELYPVKRLRLTAEGPWPAFGGRLPMNVPAQQVVVLEVRPAPSEVDAPRLFGLPGTIEISGSGYRVKTSGLQGRTERFAIMLPRGSQAIATAAVLDHPKEPDPRLSTPTRLALLSSTTEGALFEITFRRMPAPAELRAWRVQPGGLAEGLAAGWHAALTSGEVIRLPLFTDTQVALPLTDDDAGRLGLGPLANFCGAYVDNAFSEVQETWIELYRGNHSWLPEARLASREHAPVSGPLHSLAKSNEKSWWLETSVHFPFIYSIGAEPSFEEHTILVFPLLRHKEVKALRAWINAKELNVQRYAYPRNRKLACYYADLVGTAAHGADNKLVVHFTC